jgi:hypothetical protein
MISSRKMALAGALLVMSAGSMAFAQGQGQQQMPMMGPDMMGQGMMGWGMQGMMGPGMRGMMGQGMMMGYGPMMEGRLAYLKAELGITDAQIDPWNGYVSAVKARAATMQGMHATMLKTMQSGTAVERLQAHTEAMQSMLESMKALLPATEALYNALSDEQKKKADLLLGNGCCMM